MDLSAITDIIIAGIVRGGLFVMMALGLSIIFGVMNIPNFAHGEFYMIGAYCAYYANAVYGLNPIVSIALAGMGGFAVGALIEKTAFTALRKKSVGNWVMNSFLLTAGLSIMLQNLAQAIMGVRYMGIRNYWEGNINILPSVSISIDRFAAFIIAMVTVVFFWAFLHKTKTGNSIRAVSEDENGAMLVGINLNKVHTLTFSLGAMLAAIAGAALLSINPAYPTIGLAPLYKSWYVVILVGMGNIWGTIIGGFLVGLIEAFSYYNLGAGWQDVVSLVIIMLILALKPSGLFGKSVKGVWDR
ncbi:MAG: branched-chain amino acid ABC transporter permease [Bacillota bacterium]|nr:branched-chain amino acid ABC transporter permease [Bacillota bacterium]